MNITILHKGDFGNPNDSGNAKMVLRNVPNATSFAAGVSTGQAFHDTLKTTNIIGTNCGNVTVGFSYVEEHAAPPAGSNVDEKLLLVWQGPGMSEPTQFTFSGINPASAWLTLEAAGLRLNATGRAAMQTAIENLYGYAADSVTIFEGVAYRKE